MESMEKAYIKGDQPVPGYRLVKFLGKGGFGSVWRATGPGGIDVALKIIALDNKQGFKEFRAIRMVKNIHHPHLVPINGFWLKDSANSIFDDSADSDSFVLKGKATELIIAMGLGEKSLLDRLGDCRKAGGIGIETEELLGYMEGAARAIDFLNRPVHNAGSGPMAIQHCDIKPQNILIVGGEAQVCDFGLARVLGDPRATQSGGAMSLPYTPPEILTDTKPSQSSDQYALAITYYELRTGDLPFEDINNPGNLMWRIMQGKLDLSRLPSAEQEVVRRATAPEPKQRFGTSLDMVRELRKILDGVATTPSKPRPASGHEAPGQEIVPGYKLIRRLGQGGYGTVWEAQAPGGKPVAVKVIHNVEGVSGKQEFRALEMIKALEHEYLLELHAYWLKDKEGEVIPDEVRHNPEAPDACTLVIATRLAKQNLLQRLHECQKEGHTGIPPSELLTYISQAADAIDFLNEPQHKIDDKTVSIQHRDIKPENILLVGRVAKVGDFGLAKVLEGTSALVHGHSAGFTPHYAAPELFNGQVSRWTDQYCLAITYYKLRTGRLPFDGMASLGELLSIHMEGRLDFSALGNDEQEVLRRATALIPEDRYETCRQMAEHLAKAVSVSGVSEHPLGPTVETLTPIPAQATPRKTPMLASLPEPDALPGMIATAMPEPNPIGEYGSTPTHGETIQPIPAAAIAAQQKAKSDRDRAKAPAARSKPRTDPDRASEMPAAKGGWKDQGHQSSPSKSGIGLGLPVAIFVAVLSAAGIGYGVVRHWPTSAATNRIADNTGQNTSSDTGKGNTAPKLKNEEAKEKLTETLAQARSKLDSNAEQTLAILNGLENARLTERQRAERQLITAQAYARLPEPDWSKVGALLPQADLGAETNAIAEVLGFFAHWPRPPSDTANTDMLHSALDHMLALRSKIVALPDGWEKTHFEKWGVKAESTVIDAVTGAVARAQIEPDKVAVALLLARKLAKLDPKHAGFAHSKADEAYRSLTTAADHVVQSLKPKHPLASMTANDADKAYAWLTAARKITEFGNDIGVRTNLAVAAWLKPKPDIPKVLELSEGLLGDKGAKLRDDQAFTISILAAGAHAQTAGGKEKALDRYADALAISTKLKIPNQDLDMILLEPAAVLAIRVGQSEHAARLNNTIADLCAANIRNKQTLLDVDWRAVEERARALVQFESQRSPRGVFLLGTVLAREANDTDSLQLKMTRLQGALDQLEQAERIRQNHPNENYPPAATIQAEFIKLNSQLAETALGESERVLKEDPVLLLDRASPAQKALENVDRCVDRFLQLKLPSQASSFYERAHQTRLRMSNYLEKKERRKALDLWNGALDIKVDSENKTIRKVRSEIGIERLRILVKDPDLARGGLKSLLVDAKQLVQSTESRAASIESAKAKTLSGHISSKVFSDSSFPEETRKKSLTDAMRDYRDALRVALPDDWAWEAHWGLAYDILKFLEPTENRAKALELWTEAKEHVLEAQKKCHDKVLREEKRMAAFLEYIEMQIAKLQSPGI